MTSIYVITALPTPYVKIGCAKNPEARRRHLQTGSAYQLRVAYTTIVNPPHDAVAIEGVVHRHFVNERLYGEWFEVELGVAIKAIEAAMGGDLRAPRRGPHDSPT